jgi:hypothetical protein
VDVPNYLSINTPNPMTDGVSKSIIIPYGTEITETFNADWYTYLAVVPNTFCTYSNISTPNKIATSLFNFIYNISDEKPGVVK